MALSAPLPEALTISRFERPWPISWKTTSATSLPFTLRPVNRYICMRGALPSDGVAKLALLKPWPSLTSVRM